MLRANKRIGYWEEGGLFNEHEEVLVTDQDDDSENIELISGGGDQDQHCQNSPPLPTSRRRLNINKTSASYHCSAQVLPLATKWIVMLGLVFLLSIHLIGVDKLGMGEGKSGRVVDVGLPDQAEDVDVHSTSANVAKEQNNVNVEVVDDEITTATNLEQHHKNVLPPDEKLRVLVTKGCSGSSFVLGAIRDFLQSRGYDVEKKYPEIYKPQNNSMFELAKELAPKESRTIDIIVNATLMLKQEAFQNGQTVVYKWGDGGILKPLMQRTRGDLLFGYMYRKNILDKVVCSVKDCFSGSAFGYPVFAVNGSKANLCFNRRESGAAKTKAYIDSIESMVERIRHLEKVLQGKLKAFDFPFQVTYEDLTDFEYTDEDSVWSTSLNAWTRMLSTYVANNWTSEDTKLLKDMMHPMRNTRNMSHHEDVIQNYQEVFEALRKAGMGGYIRSRS